MESYRNFPLTFPPPPHIIIPATCSLLPLVSLICGFCFSPYLLLIVCSIPSLFLTLQPSPSVSHIVLYTSLLPSSYCSIIIAPTTTVSLFTSPSFLLSPLHGVMLRSPSFPSYRPFSDTVPSLPLCHPPFSTQTHVPPNRVVTPKTLQTTRPVFSLSCSAASPDARSNIVFISRTGPT